MIFGGKMLKMSFKMKAEFYDVDSMNVVWHGNYVKFIESARCAFLDKIDFNYLKMKEKGFVLPVVKFDIKYIQPIFFNQSFEVEVILLEFDSFLKFRYNLKDDTGAKLCVANSAQVAVMIESKETCYNLPKALQEAFKKFTEKGASF